MEDQPTELLSSNQAPASPPGYCPRITVASMGPLIAVHPGNHYEEFAGPCHIVSPSTSSSTQ
eukprot:scaffold246459_cov36-Tisochrysis_lutea.AAC.1